MEFFNVVLLYYTQTSENILSSARNWSVPNIRWGQKIHRHLEMPKIIALGVFPNVIVTYLLFCPSSNSWNNPHFCNIAYVCNNFSLTTDKTCFYGPKIWLPRRYVINTRERLLIILSIFIISKKSVYYPLWFPDAYEVFAMLTVVYRPNPYWRQFVLRGVCVGLVFKRTYLIAYRYYW